MKHLLAVLAVLSIQAPGLAQEGADWISASSPEYRYYKLGFKFQKKGQFEKALQQYRKALSVRNDARFYAAIASIYEILQDTENALQNYRMAALLAPNDQRYRDICANLRDGPADTKVRSLQSLAMCKHISHDLLGAEANYKAALELRDDKSIHLNLAQVLFELNRIDEANEELNKAGVEFRFSGPSGDFLTPAGKPFPKPGA